MPEPLPQADAQIAGEKQRARLKKSRGTEFSVPEHSEENLVRWTRIT
jgi:hypothetical protein